MLKRIVFIITLVSSMLFSNQVNYSLLSGWNSISVPISIDLNTVVNTIGSEKIIKIWGKKGGQWVSYTPGAASFLNKLDSFLPSQSYSIDLSQDASFTLDGPSYANKSISLLSGWNNFGVFENVVPIDEFISKFQSTSDIIKIWGKKGGQWVSYTPGAASFLNKLTSLEPGSVYSIHLANSVNFNFNFILETRGVSNQFDNATVYLYVASLSSVTYKNNSFWSNGTPPAEILPITITDNSTFGIQIPGVYAGQTIQFKIGKDGVLTTVDLSDTSAGDTKIISTNSGTSATISAADFSGKTVVFQADGSEKTIVFADDMSFTEDQDTGTWAVANNTLTLIYGQDNNSTITFASTPAAGAAFTGTHVEPTGTNTISGTIVSIADISSGIETPPSVPDINSTTTPPPVPTL